MPESQNEKVSRRDFLGFATGVVSFATLASLGADANFKQNVIKVDAKKIKTEDISTDVLVIGSGMAGLFAAVKAHDAGAKVMMVSKGRLGSSGLTPFAKGIFSYDASKEKMSIDEFVAKVSRSALQTNNKAYTRQLAEYSKARVDELREWGFFDSAIYNKSFSKPMDERNIPIIERVMITNLLKVDGRVAGAVGFSFDEEKIITIKAKSVIICTGSGAFKPNGFPICDLTHDGSIMAYNIGAKITGKEWNDGHPASMKNSADSYGNWHDMFEQKPSTTTAEVHHDLGVDLNYIAYATGNSVHMGPPGSSNITVEGGPYVPKEFAKNEGPPKDEGGERRRPPQQSGEEGRPPGMGANPVGGSSAGMSIHKSEGLTPINDKCESTIKGLYAAGDALGSHMSGGIYTQIGSSLSGSAVQGAIAGEESAKYCKTIKMPKVPKEQISKIKEEILAPLKRESGYSPAWITHCVQAAVIPNFVLYIKKERMLEAALAYVLELKESHIPHIKASDLHELRLAHETINIITSAEMKLKASLMRKESRCSHYRLDYPNMDNENWQAWINIYKDKDANMAFEKQPFGTWAKA